MGSGIESCSTDTLGMKLRGRKEPHLTSFLRDQSHFTPLQAGKGGYALRGTFHAMPAFSKLGSTQDCWASLIFRLYVLRLARRVGIVLAFPDTWCYGIGI